MFTTTKACNEIQNSIVVNLFLDTNILVYLVDDLYDSLGHFIKYIDNNIFTSLVSSQYVVFEFMGVRKKEHYLRHVLLKNAVVDSNGDININKLNLSSLLKYKDSYETPDVSFRDVQADIEEKVENDLIKLQQLLNINYSNNPMHEGLFESTKGLFLTSKISKEDCLVVASAIWPNSSYFSKNLIFLSNDKDFVARLKEPQSDSYFEKEGAVPPLSNHLKSIGDKGLDLTKTINKSSISINTKKMLFTLMKKSNKEFYLGKTVTAPQAHGSLICLEIEANKTIPSNIFIVIIDRDLKFYYSSAQKINTFQSERITHENGFSTLMSIKVCFELDVNLDPDLENNFNKVSALNNLRQGGHLVFLHPDTPLSIKS